MHMKRLTLLIIFALVAAAALWARTMTGIEVLRRNNFDILRGKRVGLVTNPTGVDAALNSTVDILHNAPEVKLTALFAPEHGVRGDIPAGAAVADAVDAATGLKVFSLFGANKKPTARMLAGIDALVYDIQDIGCRSYTFISTLAKLIEACAENDVELVVLDRPNPLGDKVEGPATVDADCRSFVSACDIPYLYGLTPGELARYLNRDAKCRLSVVKMTGWNRSMTFNETGLPWVPTSPNVPTAETAVYYPATGILGELSTVSNGANFTQPFKVVASQNINAEKLADALNSLNLAGVRFRPYHAKVAGKMLHGVEVYVLNPKVAELTAIQFHIIEQLPWIIDNAAPSRLNMFAKVCGSKKFAPALMRRHKAADFLALWRSDADAWRRTVAPYLLYQ